MRRLLLPLAAVCLFCATLMGCGRTHGICDCYVEDPCFQRAPWAMPPAEIVREIPHTDAK